MDERIEITKEQASQLWRKSVFSLTEEYVKAPEVVKVSGITIGTLGNFSASIGKAKSKKTFNLSAMVAAALSGECVLTYTVQLPDDKPHILYIDTEQSQHHCQMVARRIMQLAGLPTDIDNDRITFLALRTYTPEERIAAIESALSEIPGIGLVVLDGIRDLVYDINSPNEATCIISKLMQWTDVYQLHLHTVLHQNKSDENARGHIGTEINNKAESVIQVEKERDNTEISKVTPVNMRGMEFPMFAFRINDLSLPELIEGYVSVSSSVGRPKQEPFSFANISPDVHRKALERIFRQNGGEQTISSYKDLTEALQRAYRTIGYSFGGNRVVDLKTYLTQIAMLEHDKQSRCYRYVGDKPF